VTHCLDTAPGSILPHEPISSRGARGFLAGLLPVVREGLEQGAAVLVAEPAPRPGQLRDALGPATPAT
jgi:hypothetical protein